MNTHIQTSQIFELHQGPGVGHIHAHTLTNAETEGGFCVCVCVFSVVEGEKKIWVKLLGEALQEQKWREGKYYTEDETIRKDKGER